MSRATQNATRQPGRQRKALTREPGDLPSTVVTHEHIGRGAPMANGIPLSEERSFCALVRSDVSRSYEAIQVPQDSSRSAPLGARRIGPGMPILPAQFARARAG